MFFGTVAKGNFAFVALLVGLIAIVLYESPRVAAELAISDSVEYVVSAARFAEGQGYTIEIDGKPYPPRYPPWFSLLVIHPAHLLFGRELGSSIHVIYLFAIIGASGAYLLGWRLAGIWGGIATVIGLLAVPEFRYFSKQIMTDVPFVALAILGALLFMQMTSRSAYSASSFFRAGMIAAVAASFRVTNLVLLLPFLIELRSVQRGRVIACAVLLLAPSASICAATLWYNASVFGSPFRTGYHFWFPVPYDYFTLTFSLSHFSRHLSDLAPILEVAAFVCAKPLFDRWAKTRALREVVDSEEFGRLFWFIAIISLPLLAVFLTYFYSTSRFLLPIRALLTIGAAAMIGGVLTARKVNERLAAPFLALLIVAVVGCRVVRPKPTLPNLTASKQISTSTPVGALIISGQNPLYADVTWGDDRRILPISRRVSYANSVIAWNRIPNPTPRPRDEWDARCEGLVLGGAEKVFARVALDDPASVTEALRNGVAVFLETSFIEDQELRAFLKNFDSTRVAERLYRVAEKVERE